MEARMKDAFSELGFDVGYIFMSAPRPDGRLAIFFQVGFRKAGRACTFADSVLNDQDAASALRNRPAYCLPGAHEFGIVPRPAQLLGFLQENPDVIAIRANRAGLESFFLLQVKPESGSNLAELFNRDLVGR